MVTTLTQPLSGIDSAREALIRSIRTRQFAPEVLVTHVRGEFVIGDGLLVGPPSNPVAVFLLTDSADSPGYGIPYRAKVDWRAATGEWVVSALDFLCMSCFGTGVLHEPEPRLCDTCGAAGWGVTEVIAGGLPDTSASEPPASRDELGLAPAR